MKFSLSQRWWLGLGLALLFVGLVKLIYSYLSTHQIHLHITSKILVLVLVLFIVIVFVVLPAYSVVATNEIRKRRRVPGRGSCFYFNLPIAKAVREARPRIAKAARKGPERPRILIIEDDRMASHLLESHLTSTGYEVVSCNQPDRALEVAADLQPQAITLDLLMKPTSGWEILLQLKHDPRTKNIPVIVVTIVDQPGVAIGADEYLVKPVDKRLCWPP
jgi:CheY-like chemotaxis protein